MQFIKKTAADSVLQSTIGGGSNNNSLLGSPSASLTSSIKKEKRDLISPLLMYNQPPVGKMEFDEFAMYAIERFTSNNKCRLAINKTKLIYNVFLNLKYYSCSRTWPFDT